MPVANVRPEEVGMRTAVIIVVAALAGQAQAAHWNSQDDGGVQTTLAGIDGLSGSDYKYDQPMSFFEPDCNGPFCLIGTSARRNQLIVILHGHPGPAPTAFKAFQAKAANLGYHSISLDFDYGKEQGSDAPDSLGPKSVCGCYQYCFGHYHELVWNGTEHAGLPISRYPVKDRIKTVINYLATARSGQYWDQFLNSAGNIEYSKLVMAGLSRGTNIVGWAAKHNTLSRALIFSGFTDSRFNTDLTGTDAAHPTTFDYKGANGLGYCTNTPAPPFWIVDNDWVNTGYAWETSRADIFALDSRGDFRYENTAPGGGNYGMRYDLEEIGLHTFGGGRKKVGDYSGEIAGWNTVDSHFLVVAPSSSGTDGNLCDASSSVSDPHVNIMVGTCAAQSALRDKIWTYMLTH